MVHSKRFAPITRNSGIHDGDLGAAHTVTAIEVPEGAVACSLWFADATGALVSGRVGFAGQDDSGSLAVTATSDNLGYQAPTSQSYDINPQNRVLHVASSTANAVLNGTWYYS